MDKTVVIIGANGQLGSDISEALAVHQFKIIELTHEDIEVSNFENCLSVLSAFSPSILINTSAYHNLDQCEQNPVVSYTVNSLGPRNLALICNRLRSTLVHISTDYVFDGQTSIPYIEEDLANPLNIYGQTKLAGEYAIESVAERFFILRTSAVYGKHTCRAKGHNFIQLMLKLYKERDELRVVDNEIVTPTYTIDLANQINCLILSDSEEYGLYHATCEGQTSWYNFAKEIFNFLDLDVNLNIAASDEFPQKIPRPLYSVLENRKLKSIGLNVMRPWKESLFDYLS